MTGVRPTLGRWAVALLLAWIAVIAPRPLRAQDAKTVKIAVLAIRGEARAYQEFDPTADYLGSRIEGYRFVIMPMTLTQSDMLMRRNRVDFVITQPANYAMLEQRYGISRIVTMRNRTPSGPLTRFGGVLFVRADRDDLKTLDDLRGHALLAVDPAGFGGYLMAKHVLVRQGIDPEQDLTPSFIGFPQDGVVRAIRDGRGDVGTVRTHILERMAASGEIELDEFRVLAPRSSDDFPYVHSTPLYPEWAFAVTPHADPSLAQRVAIALLELPEDHPASRAARNAGWTVPLDYEPVHALLRELHEPPYEDYGLITAGDVVRQYWLVIAGALLAAALLLLGIAHVVRLNRSLGESNAKLAHEIIERERAEHRLLTSEKMASLGQLAAGVAHELSTPLGYVYSNQTELAHHLNGLSRVIEGYEGLWRKEETGDPLAALREEVGLDAIRHDIPEILAENAHGLERMEAILTDIKVFSHVSPLKWRSVDLGELMSRCLDTVRRTLDPTITVTATITPDLPPVECLPLQLERVLLNLLFNARDAILNEGTIAVSVSHRDGSDIVIEVIDDGHGVDPTTLRRIFDPFFTTKPVGRGTGLGLSIALRIIEAHGGHIDVHSVPGQGTTFRVLLPPSSRAIRILSHERCARVEASTSHDLGEVPSRSDDRPPPRLVGTEHHDPSTPSSSPWSS